ncbi:cytochrome c oxidase subunit 3 [Pseudomonas typographi]|uniref:Cytochrome o ubiquinol oxidase subunit III n=1 Tax=Pseudomonas typographi TaxID=2715964 RepID=A0ABR7Z742_9PSED|nr:cytochrome c oxidase subunit 3 [Pseudomonas typographi]MBD1554517.1 cytochrome o ubiquinol oxidase subunit III [Pseudomonas typographi]MBD1589565.1 cytochrome o ubiquinol oxidase subunit III [Pseudomonas typographi]MBD1601369.1 cytochrome o ubiquinol oxidase subunit III [Pseudomonas typographi]
MSPRHLHPGLNHPRSPEAEQAEVGSSVFGFWIFLMSDALVFALLFAVYGTQVHATGSGPHPAQVVNLPSALLQTGLLLASSYTFGLASLALKFKAERPGLASAWLCVTLLLGLAFLGAEVHDLVDLYQRGAAPQRSGFLSALHTLVCMHGLHVATGCLWLLVMLVQIRVMGLASEVTSRLMRLALFWHFLDIIWVGIFTVVYLQGARL